jgi:hypothetical protein
MPYFAGLATLFLILGVNFDSKASQVVKVWKSIGIEDKRTKHKHEVITRALEITKSQFGPYRIEVVNVDMPPSRGLMEIKSGKVINLFIVPHSEVWDKGAIPIKIPIRLGLLSYRLLLVNKNNLHLFKYVDGVKELKHLTAGLQSDWIITQVFKKQGFKVIEGHNFEGLFQMLNRGRFDYLSRGIYEIYDELEMRQPELKNVVIEPNIALYLPMITYVYISPSAPKLAKRMQAGLSELLKNGELAKILEKYYGEDIARAKLSTRKIIEIDNSYSKHELPEEHKYIHHSPLRD